MRCNAPSPPEKSLIFKGFFHFHGQKIPYKSHTDIKITISHTGSTQKCVLLCFISEKSGRFYCFLFFTRSDGSIL